MIRHIESLLGIIFGALFLALSVLVTVETLARKIFNFSMQGADELGGYALAVGCTLAFSLALTSRNHIRVDVFHERLPASIQALLNWLSIVAMAALAVLLAWLSFKVIGDTLQYRSTAQTPWATPLIIPQTVWATGLAIFAFIAFGFALRASVLLARGRIALLNKEFQPKGTKDELHEELEDLKQRTAGNQL
jgi:TRAP-type C4-dicarboxylate transport system permease small subunit